MGLSNINAGALRSAISQCKNAINYSAENQIMADLSNESVWKCNAKNTLKDGVNKLTKAYEKLKADLDSCGVLADYAEQYQKYESENSSLKSQKSAAKSKRATFDMNEDPEKYAKYTKTISKCDSKIDSNLRAMESLEKKASAIL